MLVRDTNPRTPSRPAMRHVLIATLFAACAYLGRRLAAVDGPEARQRLARRPASSRNSRRAARRSLWRAKVAGGYSGPAVANGKVYVGDYVSALDPKSRDLRAQQGRTGPSASCASTSGRRKATLVVRVPGPVHDLVPDRAAGTPTVNDGRVYFVGAEGRLSCLDAETGKVVWQKDFIKDYAAKTPLWGFAGHPLVDGDKLDLSLPAGRGPASSRSTRRPARSCGRA